MKLRICANFKNKNMNPYENIDWMLNDDEQLHLVTDYYEKNKN